jgi:hypothetical protein
MLCAVIWTWYKPSQKQNIICTTQLKSSLGLGRAKAHKPDTAPWNSYKVAIIRDMIKNTNHRIRFEFPNFVTNETCLIETCETREQRNNASDSLHSCLWIVCLWMLTFHIVSYIAQKRRGN